jgi:vacuolar-type H+-ATPase subunit D/Vma8
LRVKISEMTSQIDTMQITYMNENFKKSLEAQDTYVRIETLQDQLKASEKRVNQLELNI